MGKERIRWIDILKGIGIICVVQGHVLGGYFVYLFHMPLFYIVAGYFLKSDDSSWQYAKKTFSRLMIPYLSFLCVLSVPDIIHAIGGGNLRHLCGLIFYKVYGGYYLQGVFAVFWFIPVLWMALMATHWMLRKGWCNWKAALAVLAFSYTAYLWPRPLPLCIHVVPLAIFYVMIGNLSKNMTDRMAQLSKKQVCVWLLLAVVALAYPYSNILCIDMKYTQFGVPVLSVALSLLMIALLSEVSMIIDRHTKWMAAFLAAASQASLIIMYLHMPLHFRLIDKVPLWCDFLISLGLSWASYYIIIRYRITRKFLLGKE